MALAELPGKHWTRTECRRLLEAGRLEAGHYELLQGEIVSKMGQGRLHIFVVTRLIQILIALFGLDRIQSQSSLPLDEENEPEPDIAVLRGSLGDYLDRDPAPADVCLVVEVADTTLRTDRAIKALLYARAGIPEYWIANIPDRTLECYREPGPNGFGAVRILTMQDSIAPLNVSETILIADIFPPPSA